MARLPRRRTDSGIVPVQNTAAGFAPFFTSAFFSTMCVMYSMSSLASLVRNVRPTAPLPRVFQGMFGLKRTSRGYEENFTPFFLSFPTILNPK